MASFITIGYGDRAGYEQSRPDSSCETRPTRTMRGCGPMAS